MLAGGVIAYQHHPTTTERTPLYVPDAYLADQRRQPAAGDRMTWRRAWYWTVRAARIAALPAILAGLGITVTGANSGHVSGVRDGLGILTVAGAVFKATGAYLQHPSMTPRRQR